MLLSEEVLSSAVPLDEENAEAGHDEETLEEGEIREENVVPDFIQQLSWTKSRGSGKNRCLKSCSVFSICFL